MRTLQKTVVATERYVGALFVRVCSVLGDVSRKFVIVADDEHDLHPDDHLFPSYLFCNRLCETLRHVLKRYQSDAPDRLHGCQYRRDACRAHEDGVVQRYRAKVSPPSCSSRLHICLLEKGKEEIAVVGRWTGHEWKSF